jgi:hypothetical protein
MATGHLPHHHLLHHTELASSFGNFITIVITIGKVQQID